MSALSVLFLVLPLPLVFLLHVTEEVITAHGWMKRNGELLANRLPKFKPLIDHLSKLTTKSLAIAAMEQWVLLLAINAYVLVKGPGVVQVWIIAFMAFTFHLFTDIAIAIAVRRYVPGLATAVIILPYIYIGMHSIGHMMEITEMMLWAIIGIAIGIINLRFAHKLGMKLTRQTR